MQLIFVDMLQLIFGTLVLTRKRGRKSPFVSQEGAIPATIDDQRVPTSRSPVKQKDHTPTSERGLCKQPFK